MARIFFLFLLVSLLSCDFINPPEPIPGYIEIDSVTVEHELNARGITDVWVWVNGNNMGVYGLPAKFPILNYDTCEIMLKAGIKVNGISATRSYYPFYTAYKKQVVLVSGEIEKINPKIKYFDWVDIPWKENFEEAGIAFTRDASFKYKFEKISNNVFEKNYVGAIFLDSTRNLFEEVSIDQLSTPQSTGSSGLFLEMNFNCDMIFAVSLYVYNNGLVEPVELVNLLPTNNEWKKIYIDLYSPLSSYPKNTLYKVVFSNINYTYGTVINQPHKLNSKVYVDDIKIIQQKD